MGEPTPRALLRHLYSGGTAQDFLSKHQEEYGLIALWKKEDPDFAESYEEAISASRTSNHDRSLEAREPEWQDAFLAAYRELGPDASIAAAHNLLTQRGFKLSVGAIYARMAKSNVRFDEQFTERFLSAEAQRLAPIEDKLQQQMAAGEIPAIAYKHLQQHPLTRDRYQAPAQKFEVSSQHTNIEERRATLRLEMIQWSKNKFGPEKKEIKDVSRIKGEATEVGSDEADIGNGQDRRGEDEATEEVPEDEEVAV